jgi:hypothetical protein
VYDETYPKDIIILVVLQNVTVVADHLLDMEIGCHLVNS